MPTVRVDSSDITFEVSPDEPITPAARRAGYYWPMSCSGTGSCMLCWTRVEAGAEHLVAPTPREQHAIDYLMGIVRHEGKPVRLACQLRVTGDDFFCQRLVVNYADGVSEELAIGDRISVLGGARIIDFKGGTHVVRSVEFWYFRQPWQHAPLVTLYGTR